MRRASRARRAVLLLALALAAGGLAASQVRSNVRDVESRVGTPVPVVVAADNIRAGERFEPGRLDRLLTVRDVPESFVPPDSLVAPEEAAGLRAAVPIAADGYLTAGHLETGLGRGAGGPLLAPGERIVEVSVAGGDEVAAAPPGARVDVLVTTGLQTGSGRSYVALQDAELVHAAQGGGEVSAPSGAVAALRVTLEQAVMLTAAQNFAREIRLLVRSPDDRRRVGPTSVDAADL